MVDVKSPFHLTLINVAFAKLEQKSSNDISNFFSPQKSTCQSDVNNASCSQNTADTFIAVPKESDTSNKSIGSVLESGKNSPRLSPKKKVSGIEKWFVKQGSDQSAQATCSTGITNDFPGIKKSLKRLSSDNRCNENDAGNVAKRKCDNYSREGRFKLPSNIAELLPPDLDLNVFLELPPDIQKDILDSKDVYGQSEIEKQSISSKGAHSDISVFIPSFSMPCSSSLNIDSNCKTKGNIDFGNRATNTANEVDDDGDSGIQYKNIPNEASLETFVTVNRDRKNTSDKQSASGFESLSKNDVKQGRKQPENNINSGFSKSRADNSESVTVPDNVDPVVFESLPSEIKDELIKQWKKDKPVKTPRTGEPKRQEKCFFKSPKPSSSNNIMNYFSKK